MAAIDCVVLSSDSESDNKDTGGCEEMQSSILEAHSEVEEQNGDECLTPPRPKKSKSVHVGAAQYKCKYNSVWSKEFPFIAPVQGDPYR